MSTSSTVRGHKPSLIAWMQGVDVPSEWHRTKVKHLIKEARAGDAITSVQIEPLGEHPVYGGNGRRGYTDGFTHAGAYLLIGRQGALCGNVHLVSGTFWASEHAIVCEPRPDVVPRWLAYLLEVMDLGQYSVTAAQPGIGVSQVVNIETYVPAPAEQWAIANFLDEQTSRIDTLIAEQNQLIDALRERRIVVHESLARHVGEGDRLKWSIKERDVRAGSAAHEIPLMSVSIDWGVRRRDSITSDETRAEDLSNYKLCESGDIVVNRMRAFQGALGVAPEPGIVSPDYAVLHVDARYRADWLAAVMRTQAFVNEIVTRIRGIGGIDSGSVRTPRINVSDLLDIRVSQPPLGMQAAAREELGTLTSQIDTLITKTTEHIGLANERRAALITAAVTGQIDVRTAAQTSAT
jgi:type I restriction enzyme S subunit